MTDIKPITPVIMTGAPIIITAHIIQPSSGEPKSALTYNNIHIPTTRQNERRRERRDDSCIDIIMCYFCCNSIQNTDAVGHATGCCSDCSCDCDCSKSSCDCDCDCDNDDN